MRKKILIIITTILIVGTVVGGYYLFARDVKEKTETTDSIKFAQEYDTVDEDNVFAYRSAEEIIKILENGTGLVYLGYPECDWCKAYVVYLNDMAQSLGIKKIYYFNIKQDRADNTENYQQIVKLLDGNLQYDDEGNPRIYVPHVAAVKDGKIIGNDYESSKDLKGAKTPKEYWTEERVKDLKTRLYDMMIQITDSNCNDCN